MSNTVPISNLTALNASQVTNGDVFPITNENDNTTYKLSLQNLDTFIKTSPSSSKVFLGTINNATYATSSLSSTTALTASYASGSGVTALTASYAASSSVAQTAISAGFATVANTVLNPLTATQVPTSSMTFFLQYNPAASNGTSSFSISASSALNSVNSISSSNSLTSSTSINSLSASVSISASYARSSSFAVSASYVQNAQITNIIQSLPIGSIMAFTSVSIPTGWLECNGAIVPTASFQPLYSVVQNNSSSGGNPTADFGYLCDVYGSFNPLLGTYFKLPDLRGEFVRGYDNGRGIDTGRTLGSFQSDAFKSHSHTLPADSQPTSTSMQSITNTDNNDETYSTDHLTGATGSSETRPRNIALIYCIRYANLESYNTITTGSYISGDVVGSLSSSVVTKIQGLPVASGLPNTNDILVYTQSMWQPTAVSAFPSLIKATARFSASWVNGSPSSPNAGDTIALDPVASPYNISSITQTGVGKFTISSSMISASSIVMLTSNYQEFTAHVSGSRNEGIQNGYVKVITGRGSWTYSNIPFSIVVI
jgi:microcystin-dependent protein